MQRGRSRSALSRVPPASPSFATSPGPNRTTRKASGRFVGVCYGRFMRMPAAMVLPVLWLSGTALLGSCAWVLYALGTLLASAGAGA